ncbi:hypothetical protein BJ944DRAFT_158586 [Cunninghamella echinulata]|nr:hypothetical protein BJ944DRAFT_158586 [Cunninghamella echinulata]
MYQNCIENYPNSWDKSCIQQKKALTKCSEENVGILKYVKQHCGKSILAYDECLATNANEPEKCVQALKDLYYCTEATSAVYKERQAKENQSTENISEKSTESSKEKTK